MTQATGHREMQLYIYGRRNPGVFTKWDTVGIDCRCQEERAGGLVHLAQGGSVVVECLLCGTMWSIAGMPTHDHGPLPPKISNPLGQLPG